VKSLFRQNKHVIGVTCLLMIPALACLAGAERETVKIGGARSAVAVIAVTADFYSVEVSFIPVSTFDGSKNKVLNASKAARYALVAVSKKTGIPDGEDFSVVGLQCLNSGQSNNLFHASFLIPIAGIRRQQNGSADVGQKKGPPSSELRTPGVSDNSLLSRSDDYLHSIREIGELVVAALNSTSKDMTVDELDREVAGAIDEVSRNYEELLVEITKDKLLLQLEVRELRQKILEQQKCVLAEINEIRKKHEKFAAQMLGF